ncbi:MAG: T9SS type A sorting domain-containing protein [Saprospiraceae bacterium]|nr:T9SS type A sorting domain-containing protein [Saprospiraceae bacterium]
MRIFLVAFSTIFAVCTEVSAQQWYTQFFPGNNGERLTALGQDPIGNFVTVSTQFGAVAPRILLTQISPDGVVLQVDSTTFDINNQAAADYFSIQTPNGDWIFASDYANHDYYFHVGDSLQLTQQPGFAYPYDVDYLLPNPLGGVDLFSKPFFSNYPIQIVRLEADGSIVWDSTYFNLTEHGGAAPIYVPTSDGGLLCAFQGNFYPNSDTAVSKLWLYKIDSNGSLQKEDYHEFDLPGGFQATGYGNLFRMAPAGDFCYAIFAKYIVKIDLQGNIVWTKNFHDIVGQPSVYVDLVKGLANGNLLVCRKTDINAPQPNPDYFYFEVLNPNGELLGQRIIRADTDPNLSAWFIYIGYAIELADGSIVVGGRIGDFSVSDNFLLKLSADDVFFPFHVLGKVFSDETDDCSLDPTEPGWPDALVEVTDDLGTYYFPTDSMGEYSAGVKRDSAILRVNTGYMHPYFAVCDDSLLVAFNGADTVHLDLPVQQVADCPLMWVDISTPFLRRCSGNYYIVNYCNYGTAPAQDASLQVTLDSNMQFLLASVLPESVIENTISFQLGDLSPNECGTINIIFSLDCETQIGDRRCAQVSALPNTICAYTPPILADVPYFEQDCRIVQASYDPNEKTAIPQPRDGDWVIHPDSTIKYVIKFQNTGTDTAFRVMLLDTLSALLDPLTVAPLSASHPFDWQILQNGTLQFRFDPIQLPDSTTNEAASHGFVKFSIRPRTEQPLGTLIHNRAAIYFDQNEPVITNTHTYRIDKPYLFLQQEFEGCLGDTLNGYVLSQDFSLVDSTDLGDSILVQTSVYTVFPTYFIEKDTSVQLGVELFGQVLLNDTILVLDFASAHGCDSTVAYNVDVLTSSQEQPSWANSMHCYPNPAVSELVLEWTTPIYTGFQWYLTDPLGRLLQQGSMTNVMGENRLSLDIHQHPSGSYLLTVSSGGKLFSWGVVKQ